jgi:hypothetical protein
MGPYGRQSLSLSQQQFSLKSLYPDSTCRSSRGVLEWLGRLQPSELGRSYSVSIRYEVGATPQVNVVSPSLREIADGGHSVGRRLPHVYSNAGDPLCLFFGKDEWNSCKLLARTTVPWTSLWLEFFEVWAATNTWEGSGAPLSPRNVSSEEGCAL